MIKDDLSNVLKAQGIFRTHCIECPHKPKLDEATKEVAESSLKISSILEEFHQLSKLYEELIGKWRDGLDTIKCMEKEKLDIIDKYEKKLKHMSDNTCKEEVRLLKENERLKAKFENFKKEIMHELKVKDLIVSRHKNFEDILKKELTIAKTIMKDPSMMKKAQLKLNYDTVSGLCIYPNKVS